MVKPSLDFDIKDATPTTFSVDHQKGALPRDEIISDLEGDAAFSGEQGRASRAHKTATTPPAVSTDHLDLMRDHAALTGQKLVL